MPQAKSQFKSLKSSTFKILTCFSKSLALSGIFFQASVFNANAETLSQETFKTHLRWSLNAKKDSIALNKSSNRLTIKTLDNSLFSEMAGDISKMNMNKEYFKEVNYSQGKDGAPSEIKVDLKDQSVELFTFFKDKQDKHILDFWINHDLVATKKAAIQKTPEVKKVLPAPRPKKTAKKAAPKKKLALDKEIDVLNAQKAPENPHKGHKDFRYGAAFVWDYNAFIPPLESEVNLAVKGPDYFYEVQDRPVQDGDDKETHMQLSINFYNKQKWGLMTKSIELYEKRYEKDQNSDLNDFMKAVSMIKNAISPKVNANFKSEDSVEEMGPRPRVTQKGIFSAAASILNNVIDRTDDYEMKKASMRYLLEASLRDKDHISALQIAKQLYVAATGEFDDEMIVRSSRAILYSLAHLRQLDKMEEFLQNKAVIRVLPAQEGDAYISFARLAQNDREQVIARFRANESGYTKPIHPAILFNTAEAYFRGADYEKAIALFDDFVANYSFYEVAGKAGLRVALSYDLLGRDENKVLKLYENAINKSSDPQSRFEAKIRYVGLRVARKNKHDERDLETISFLEATPAEKSEQNQNLKELLWLTRLRTFIAKEDYEGALAYLSSIPLENLRQVDRRAFDGDGAEIVLGIVKKAYLNEDYARAVKVWEVFRGKYEDKVAKNPYANFIVSDAYLKLGLDKSFERSVKELEGLKKGQNRVFPRWVRVHKRINLNEYLDELKLVKLTRDEKWKEADSFLSEVKDRKNINYNYYKGLVSYRLKKYNEAVKFFEGLLVEPNAKNMLSPIQSLTMLTAYAESLYQGNDQERFRKNTAALVNDLRRSGANENKKKRKKAVERLEYLYIESLNGEGGPNNALISDKAGEFLKEHEKSSYHDRVKYLRGVALIKASNQEEGKTLLEELISGAETPEYIKGLARSELSSLTLENKKL